VTNQTSNPSPPSSWSRKLAEHKLRRGEELEQRGETALAIRAYNDALTHDRTFGIAYLKLANLRELMGDTSEAELLYEQATLMPEVRALALVRRALLRRRLGRGEEAVRDLQTALDVDGAPEALKALANWYVQRRDWPAALAAWRRIFALAVRNANRDEMTEAELSVRALSVLAGETDVVLHVPPSSGWVRRSLSKIAQHPPPILGREHAQPGVRKLAP
jgi:tetratricopeptide (TPR) repeat protein